MNVLIAAWAMICAARGWNVCESPLKHMYELDEDEYELIMLLYYECDLY